MPTYVFRRGKKIWQEFMSMSEMDQFLKDNPNVDTVPATPGIISGINQKPEKGFRELLSKINKNTPGGRVNDFGG